MQKGIDISKWQANVDMKRVKESGVEFVMVRALSGKNVDKYAFANYAMCRELDMGVGFYQYNYALTEKGIRQEAQLMIEFLKDKKVNMPICLDMEDSTYRKLPVAEINRLARIWLEMVEGAGYYVMIYSNNDWMKNVWQKDLLEKYDLWYARYKANGYQDFKCGLWQSSSTGTVPGINGNCDVDYALKDLREIIERKGLNNLG